MTTHSLTESRTLLCALEEKIGRDVFADWVIDACKEYKQYPLYACYNLLDYIVNATEARYKEGKHNHPQVYISKEPQS